MGDTDEVPIAYRGLIVRQILWEGYGVSLGPLTFEEAMLALRLNKAQGKRVDAMLRKQQNG